MIYLEHLFFDACSVIERVIYLIYQKDKGSALKKVPFCSVNAKGFDA